MSTLGDIKEAGYRITIHCGTLMDGRACVHYAEPDIDQLIQYLGVDFDIAERRAEFLSRFECGRCGSRNATVQVCPPIGRDGLMAGAGGAHAHGPMPTREERARSAAEFEEEFRARGGEANAEIAAYWRARRKNQELAEKGKGPGFIGPLNPWAHRKGRWL
jgi:hypothetical protein